jgi:hypothetical protein
MVAVAAYRPREYVTDTYDETEGAFPANSLAQEIDAPDDA